jgi:hypothetical protein
MLSTRFGYGRPADLAEAFALAFCAAVNGVDFFLGFFVSQTGFVVDFIGVYFGLPGTTYSTLPMMQ